MRVPAAFRAMQRGVRRVGNVGYPQMLQGARARVPAGFSVTG